MKRTLERIWAWIDRNALMVMAFVVSLSSSGIDGAYMAKMMSAPLWWTGYILNTVSDIAALVLANWYGRLERGGTGAREEQIKRVLWGEYVAIGYSWLFSWRQLRPIIAGIETAPLLSVSDPDILAFLGEGWGLLVARMAGALEIEVITFVIAGFVPVTNAFLGYAQSLRDGKFRRSDARVKSPVSKEPDVDTNTEQDDANVKPIPVHGEPREEPVKPIDKSTFLRMVSEMNGDAPTDAEDVLIWLQRNHYETKSASTRRRWGEAVEALKSNGGDRD